MGALDHKTARGPAPPIASRDTQDVYSQMMLFRPRSPSFIHDDDDELVLKGQAARKGKSSVIALAMAGIAHTLEKRSLDQKLAVLGVEDSRTIDFMVQLGKKWFEEGWRYEEAEKVQVQVLDARRERWGMKHPDTLDAMANLSRTWSQQKRYKESEAMEKQVLACRKEVLGDYHPDTLHALKCLAFQWKINGKMEKAQGAYRHIIGAKSAQLGLKHPDTLESLVDIAKFMSHLGQHKEAEVAVDIVVKAQSETLGPTHRQTILSMRHLSTIYYDQCRYVEAESMQRQILDLQREVLGKDDGATVQTMQVLALTWYALGRLNDAEGLMRESVELFGKLSGPPRPWTLKWNDYAEKWREECEEREREAQDARETIELLELYEDEMLDDGMSDGFVTEEEASENESEILEDNAGPRETDDKSWVSETTNSRCQLPPLRRPAKAMLKDRQARLSNKAILRRRTLRR